MPFPTTALSKPPLHPADGVDYFDTLATPTQVSMIHAHAIAANLNAEYESWCMFTRPVAHLTKKEARTLIAYLRECAQF